jgi:hypothetical protein
MSGSNELRALFNFLAGLYDAEGRQAGTSTANALRKAATDLTTTWPLTKCPKPGLAERALQIDPHPQVNVILDAIPHLEWFSPDASIANLKAAKGEKMMACELLGPNGMIKHTDFRVGLYVQDPHFHYSTRTHTAEETYIALGGVGYWSTEVSEPTRKSTGDIMFHPSMIEHQNLTKDDPMIAVWRWSGDISYDNYYTD